MRQIILAAFFSLTSSVVFAQAKATKATKTTKTTKPAKAAAEASAVESYPYGMAGCGLGGLVIRNHSTGPQIGAYFLNILGYQSYALSSGTSNCVERRTEVAALEQEVYITANLNSLTKDAAQGGGDVIDGLAEVFGCLEGGDSERLARLSQKQFSTLFATAKPELVLESYLNVVNRDPALRASCTRIS